jgi:hypothetical protein|tara:strand:+ start:300 stop:884 length:585 start_codon:yes stop_codon:yes gene_type:complete
MHCSPFKQISNQFKFLYMSRYQFKTTNIKGKEYVEVNQRIKYFRESGEYKGWSLTSDVYHLDEASCVIKAAVLNDKGQVVANGFAQEDKSSSYINKTSYVENCETSAWGRALANLGIGIDTSIASSNEVSMAISKQGSKSKVTVKETTEVVLMELTDEIREKMVNAVKAGKKDVVVKALDKYNLTQEQRNEILA